MSEPTRRTELPSGAERLGPGDPATIGAYELVGRLGAGGMGSVYLGRDDAGRYVAIKVIRAELAADGGFRARFRDEVSNAERVASFCTAKVLDHGEADGRPYMVTEYVDGRPLEDHIEQQGALPEGTLHGVAVGVAAALTAIHAAGLIHRDLKPSNVLLSVSGPRVIDFGIARATDAPSGHTQTGFVVGTPGWMAPEQVLKGEVSKAADIFAWGCLVAFSGTGRNPYGTGTVMTMAARAENGEHDLTGLAEPLRTLVEHALSPAPEDRPDAQQLLLELVGGAAPAAAATAAAPTPTEAEAAVDAELTRNWQVEALPPPWVPPSPPQGVRVPTRMYESAPPRQQTPPPMAPRPMTPPPQPMQWVPTQPPRMMAPGPMPPPAPRRSRGRGCLGCLAVMIVLAVGAVVAGIVAYQQLQPIDGRLNTPVKDGQFTFVASSFACGISVREADPPSSYYKYCRLRITVTNSGTKTRTLSPDYQYLRAGSGDDDYQARTLLQGTSTTMKNQVSARPLPPGSRFTGMLLFLVPTTFQPQYVTLHDARITKGVRIPVDND